MISTVACGVVLDVDAEGDVGVRTGGTDSFPVDVDPDGGVVVVLVGAGDAAGAPEVSALAELPKIFDIMSPKMLMTRLPVGLDMHSTSSHW